MNTSITDSIPALLFTGKEAKQALKVSARTLFTLTKRGDIPVIRIGTRGIRYAPADLQAWIDRQRSTSTGNGGAV